MLNKYCMLQLGAKKYHKYGSKACLKASCTGTLRRYAVHMSAKRWTVPGKAED